MAQLKDFARWAEQWGCGDDWRHENVAPHFAALERLIIMIMIIIIMKIMK